MTVLVFGKTGQVARELAQYSDVRCLDRADADLLQPLNCGNIIRRLQPEVVINAAAFTGVDEAEQDEALATVINGDAPAAMAVACAEMAVPFVHISTDYVFDGTGSTAFAPDHETCPLGAYGRSKQVGERGVVAAGGKYAILRTSWVYSRHGKNFLKTMLRLSETRDQLGIVNDQIGGPTPAAAIAAACYAIAGGLLSGSGGAGIYHFSGMPEVSWADFAAEIFAQSGRQVTITEILTQDYPTPAKRPLNSRLNCDSLKEQFGILRPDWRTGLEQLCKDIEVN